MLKVLGWGLYVATLLVLTAATQVGGAVLMFSTLVVWSIFPSGRLGRIKAFFTHLFAFVMVYATLCTLLVPPVARIYGRVALPCLANDAAAFGALNPLTCVLNRNYAAVPVAAALSRMASDLDAVHAGTIIAYLDAGFPFLDGFPMLPHITHTGGRDLDLAYFYTDAAGAYLPAKARSPIGYWGFEQPPGGTERRCTEADSGLTRRWDLAWLQPHLAPYLLDEKRTADLLGWLVMHGPANGVTGVTIEPHMAERLGVYSQLIRFQGCAAARHDDHIHVDFDPSGS